MKVGPCHERRPIASVYFSKWLGSILYDSVCAADKKKSVPETHALDKVREEAYQIYIYI